MNRTNFILLVTLYLLFTVIPGYAQQKQMPGACTDELKLSNTDFIYDEPGKLFYLITNTKENLLVHVRANDETTQKKLINNGFSIEIKNKGGEKEKLQIDYPLPKEERMQPIILLADNSHNERNNFSLVKSQLVAQINRMRVTDLAEKDNSVLVPAENNSGISGCMTIAENGDLQYLLVVSRHRLGVDLLENNSVDIRMTSGNADMPKANSVQPGARSGMNSSGRGGMSGGGKGGKGGGMGGGRHGGGGGGAAAGNNGQKMGQKQALFTPIKIRIKSFIL